MVFCNLHCIHILHSILMYIYISMDHMHIHVCIALACIPAHCVRVRVCTRAYVCVHMYICMCVYMCVLFAQLSFLHWDTLSFKCLLLYVLQERLKEAQRKEQELIDKLRQYRVDLTAAKVYCTVSHIMLMCMTGMFMVLICTGCRVQGTNWSNPRWPWKRRRLPLTRE